MLVHGFCFFKLVFIGPKELKPYRYAGVEAAKCASVLIYYGKF